MLLGRGGEASVYALDEERVLRIHRPGPGATNIERRASLLEALATHAPPLPFAIPRVLEARELHERWVTIEARLPGHSLASALERAEAAERRALLRSYLEAVRLLSEVRCPGAFYGDLLADDAIHTSSFRDYAQRRARRSLDTAGGRLATLDAAELARGLPEPQSPAFVYLDAHPSNVLVSTERVSAVIDFGGAAIAGDARFGATVAATYLSERDQPVAQEWLAEQGLSELYGATRRWIAAFWSFARDDTALFGWCQRVLLE
jgi:aminoglycoside phosphotransferase (APT) family kinase protein